MTTYLQREEILGAQDLAVEDVEVPEWGGTVRVRGLSADEKDSWEGTWYRAGADGKPAFDFGRLRANLIVRCVVDEQGKRIFQDADAPALGAKSGQAVDRVFVVASRLSAITPRDMADLGKNSGRDQPA